MPVVFHAVPAATPPQPGVLALGPGDAGRSISVGAGTQIHVTLTNAVDLYQWSQVSSSNTAVVMPQPAPPAMITRGTAIAWFVTTSAGTATLSATDDPTCATSLPPCEIPSKLWQVTIIVG